jgi:outer membrane lipoprotein-sorting protein
VKVDTSTRPRSSLATLPAGDCIALIMGALARSRNRAGQLGLPSLPVTAVSFFRRISTARLLALCAAAVALVFACVAVASAVSSDPAPPPAKPLAEAIHAAASAPAEQGVTARIEWTNKLVDANGFEGISPLIAGGKGRLWWSADDALRLELQGSSGDVQIVVKGREYWGYDAASNQAWRGTLPPEKKGDRADREHRVPTVAQIERKLRKAMKDVAIAGPEPGVEAGQPSYSVRVSPRENGGLLGAVGLAWDAARGTPLRFGLYARGSDSPVAELRATDVEYGPVDSSAFAIAPPPGAKVTDVSQNSNDKRAARAKLSDLTFDLAKPDTLAGKKLTDVHPVGSGEHAGAALVYGEGLGAIVVVERPYVASDQAGKGAKGGDHQQVKLPTTDVNGTQATVLDTPLGGGLQWTRGGVTYVVAASAPRSVLEAAARGL